MDSVGRLVASALVVIGLYYVAYIAMIDPGLRKYWREKATKKAARKRARTHGSVRDNEWSDPKSPKLSEPDQVRFLSLAGKNRRDTLRSLPD